MSHCRAASVAATRSFVTPANAETTTIGNCDFRSATMSIAFATRCASPTEVPPNLMTIMARPRAESSRLSVLGSQKPFGQPTTDNRQRSQQPLRLEQLRIQDRHSRGAANGVVHQRDHPKIEQRARTEPADRDAHPSL